MIESAERATSEARRAEEGATRGIKRRLDERIAIEAAVGAAFGHCAGDRKGAAETARLRQIAMYLMHVARGIPMERVAKAFGRDRSTVGHACRVVEDKRDDPRFDQQLNCAERAALALIEACEIGRGQEGEAK